MYTLKEQLTIYIWDEAQIKIWIFKVTVKVVFIYLLICKLEKNIFYKKKKKALPMKLILG